MNDDGYSAWTVTVGEASITDCPRCGNLLATQSTHVFGYGLDIQGAFERLHCLKCRVFMDRPTHPVLRSVPDAP